MFARISEIASPTFYCISGTDRKKLTGTRWEKAWWLGIWELKGYGGKFVKGLCPTFYEIENVKHVILSCSETAGWRMNLNCKKWSYYLKEFVVKESVHCDNSFLSRVLEIRWLSSGL
jgi:hypothetical protein